MPPRVITVHTMFYFLDADNRFLFYPRYPQPLREDRMNYSMADRLRARCRQLGLNTVKVGELAGVNRTFVYDIMRGRSESPNLEKLQRIADVLKVERNWLLHGLGEVEGESPIIENPDLAFVAVPYVNVRASMGGGQSVDDEPDYGRPYHFQKSWIKNDLQVRSSQSPHHACRGRQHDAHAAGSRHRSGGYVAAHRRRRRASSYCTTAWGLWPRGSNTSPTPIRRGCASFPTIRTTPPTKVSRRRSNIVGRIRWFARDM